MTESKSDEFEFDVAVSFAGEDREYVEDVVNAFKAAGISVFYDQDFLVDTWGQDLVEYFDNIYRVKARYAILFISRSYANRMWTRHERRSVLARALEQDDVYVLPIRLDDTDLEGLRPTIGYLDARRVGLDGVIEASLTKFSGVGLAKPNSIERVPRSESERQQVLLQRPPLWEYLYFTGLLLHERDEIEVKYRDHELRFAPRSGEYRKRDEMPDYLHNAISDASRLADSLNRVMDPDAQERAFGATGEPGDPDRLLHLARRWNAIYEGFLDWAARLRGVGAPPEYEEALELLAHYSDDPIRSYREFVDNLADQVNQAVTSITAGEPVQIVLTLVLTIPNAVQEAYHAQMRQVSSRP